MLRVPYVPREPATLAAPHLSELAVVDQVTGAGALTGASTGPARP